MTGPVVNTLSLRGFTCEIRSDNRFFTVRDSDGRAVGTVIRPRYNESRWEATNKDGANMDIYGRGFIGSRTAFIAIVRHMESVG